jgi:hypothetical protein
MAFDFIERESRTKQRAVGELQKGQLALDFLSMNISPKNFHFLKRRVDNDGTVRVPGFNSVTGQKQSQQHRPTL